MVTFPSQPAPPLPTTEIDPNAPPSNVGLQIQAGVSKGAEVLPQAPQNPLAPPQAEEGTSLLDAIGAAALITNSSVSLGDWLVRQHEEDTNVDPNFDSFTYLSGIKNDPRIQKLSPILADRIGDVLPRIHNERQFWQYIDGLEIESDRVRKAGEAGILPLLAGGLIGVVTDPLSWIGVGLGAKLGSAMRLGGAARGALAGAVEGAVPGAVQIATRETYGVEDLATDIAAGTALGGVLGKFLLNDVPASTTARAFAKDAPDDGLVLAPNVDAADVLGSRTLSSAEANADEAGTRGRLYGFDILTPVGRAIKRSSQNPADFALHQKLYEMSVATKGNESGNITGESAEMLSELFHLRSIIRDEEVKTLYNDMAREVFAEGGMAREAKNLLNRKDGRMTAEQFYETITEYRRAQSVLDYEGQGASQAARDIVDKPHANPKVAEYIKRASEVEQKFFTEWADMLEDAGMLTKEERRSVYVPSILDRRAVVLHQDELRQILRDHLSKQPPADWLDARYGTTDLKTLTPTDRELAIDEWVIAQKDDIEKAAKKSLKEATARVEQLTKDMKLDKRVEAKTARSIARDELARARVLTETTEKELQALRLARQQVTAEQFTFQKALDESAMRNLGRDELEPRVRRDAGEKEFTEFRKASREGAAMDIARALEGNSSDTMAALERSLEGNTGRLDAARVAAKEAPIEPPKAPSRDTSALPERIARDNLRAANTRLAQIDRDLSRVEGRLGDLHVARGELEGRLVALKEARSLIAKSTRNAARAKKRAESGVKKAERTIKALDEGRIKTSEERVEEIIERMTSGKDVPRALLEEKVGESGRLKARELFEGNILLDTRLQKFLVRDAGHIADRYSRDLSARLALHRKFGTDDPAEIKAEIYKSWRERVRDPEKAEALAKESFKDFEGVWMRLMGRLGNDLDPASKLAYFSRNLRRFNVTRLMGMPLLSSFTDVATGALATKSVFAWMPRFFQSVRPVLDKVPDKELRALLLGLEQSRFMGANVRRLMPEDTNLTAAGGIGTGQTYRLTSAIDQSLDWAARSMQSLNGLGGWTMKLKFAFGMVQLQNMQRDFAKFGSLSAKMKTRYARLGIDDTWAERINKQLQEHGDDIDGVRVPEAAKWTDKQARQRWLVALHRVQNEGAISPGAGDTPLLMSNAIGKLLLQFMSYAFASTNKWTRLALQQGDANAIASFHMMMATALLGYVAREYVKGTNSKGETPGDRLSKKQTADWVYEALTRSAIPGAYSTGIDATRKLMLGPVQDAAGVKLFGSAPSRMQERAWWSTPLGPSVGLLDNTGELAQALVRQDGQVLNKAAKLLPYQNLLPILALHSAAETVR